jgi:twitching motility protein PilT
MPALIENVTMHELMDEAVKRRASDIHITAGIPPLLRIDGRLQPLDYEALSPNECQRLVYDILTDRQITDFETRHELDLSYGVSNLGRFRVNVYMQRGAVGAALRLIPSTIPSTDDLNLPTSVLNELSQRTSGLILVTGPTGCGKSTTLACMINYINRTRECHIMTLEDPIEYLHRHRRAMVNQRELGSDTYNFPDALRAALREDPDVVLIGEMRDLDTIQAALTIAETGHLVLATLHTRNAPQAIDRMIDVFPPHQQEQVRVLLANTLEAIIAQQLLTKYGVQGRVPAVELLVVTAAVRNLIREGKTHQIYSLMETGAEQGMQTMDKALANLCRRGLVSHEEAASRALDIDNFNRWMRGM